MAKFIRVESKVTGHQFDIHEEQFDEVLHKRVKRYPPSSRVRRTKFRVGRVPALSVSRDNPGEEGVGNVDDDS